MKDINKINEFIEEGRCINKKDYASKTVIIDNIESWEKKVIEYLNKNFPGLPETLVTELEIAGQMSNLTFMLYRDEWQAEPAKLIKHIKSDFEKKYNYLEIIRDYLNISDYFLNGDIPNFSSMEDKQDFILKKLHKIYNNNYYSINKIFDVNQIKYPEQEPQEIADDLKKRGYISLNDYETNTVKITVKGINYLERKNTKKSKSKRADEINKRIDTILSKLEKIGFGQEIIFNEIEELRNVSDKLTQKSWSQLIKGKVIDLALDNVINKDVAKLIYETLVDDKFKLLT